MRWNLATRITITTGSVLLLALLSTTVALVAAWEMRAIMTTMVLENLPSVRAAEELEIALLDQRGLVSSYVLDAGQRRWLDKLQEKEQTFHEWLDRIAATAHTDRERQVLAELREVYPELDSKRDQVVALYDRGDVVRAKEILLNEVPGLYDRVYELCEQFIAANEHYVDLATARANDQIRWITWIVGVCVGLTLATGAGTAWLFFCRVLLPLRRMAAELTELAGDADRAGRDTPDDDLRVVGRYLHRLLMEVAETRTSLDQSRSRLASAEKLASVGKIAAGVAHEIRNPLTSMRMCLFSIRNAVGEHPELWRKADMLAEEIGRLESIVRNFLEFARPPAPKLAAHDVSRLIDKTLELVGHRLKAKNILVLRSDESDLPPVMADADQIKQVFINLLNNAVEAMSTGGEIRITTAAEWSGDGRPVAVIRIQDAGPGIPQGACDRIFEPFFTTKDDGTGLGLAIAARVVAQHGGRLVLESSTSQGTTFAVRIPLARP